MNFVEQSCENPRASYSSVSVPCTQLAHFFFQSDAQAIIEIRNICLSRSCADSEDREQKRER